MRVGQVQPILQRLAVKAGADGGVEERLARAELLKLMRAEQQHVLVQAGEDDLAFGEKLVKRFVGHARLLGLRLAGAAVIRNLRAHEGERVRNHPAGNAEADHAHAQAW